MSLRCGIVGLPNTGKSTLFNALTAAGAPASNYPFCTIDRNVGTVAVPDQRLDRIAGILRPKKVTPTSIEFVDIAGLVRGASCGQGLGNRFLGHIREVHAVLHVIRCFDDPDVAHVDGSIDPLRDIDTVHTELCLADLDTVTKRLERAKTAAKSGDKKLLSDCTLLDELCESLKRGIPARNWAVGAEQTDASADLHLLTAKPVMYVLNVAEGEISAPSEHVQAVRKFAAKEHACLVEVSSKVEAELAELPEAERGQFLGALGLSESGSARVIQAAYGLLGLVTFFTVQNEQCQAWTVVEGTRAARAAGTIHTDFERGFVCAEVYQAEDLIREGSEAALRAKGLMRQEGRDYSVTDGDVLKFAFS